ncbi:hypothetical protein VKT23_005529 [Stygiomarasmius scandens]|uniref:YABBY protein C-terminal domain-containing protein n=1 Tax=Marasmiellus scandens TaxID=2682957 RepID=A0ABR1JV44_9AGAR
MQGHFIGSDVCVSVSPLSTVPLPQPLNLTNACRSMAGTKSAAVKEKPAKKSKSTGGGKRKKLTPFNKFMQSEMARLKEEEPDMPHQDRFKVATGNWKKAPENPNRTA